MGNVVTEIQPCTDLCEYCLRQLCAGGPGHDEMHACANGDAEPCEPLEGVRR